MKNYAELNDFIEVVSASKIGKVIENFDVVLVDHKSVMNLVKIAKSQISIIFQQK